METGFKPNTSNLNRQVYKYIQNKIITNQLEPGSRINYDELANEVGVSITPVRDALNWLQKDGFVEIKSRSGAFVKSLNYKDVEEILHVRNALEREVVSLATPHMPLTILEEFLQKTYDLEAEINDNNFEKFIDADRLFHQTIASYSNNKRIIELLDMADTQSKWIASKLVQNRERFLQANQHHRDIIKAMMDQDIESAQKNMVHHIMEIKRASILAFKE